MNDRHIPCSLQVPEQYPGQTAPLRHSVYIIANLFQLPLVKISGLTERCPASKTKAEPELDFRYASQAVICLTVSKGTVKKYIEDQYSNGAKNKK